MTLNKSFIFKYLPILALIIYSFINFVYFPLEPIFPDEKRFILEAINLTKNGEFWIGSNRALEMPLTAIIFSLFYKIVGSEESLIIVVRVFQSILLIIQAFLIYQISLKIFNDKLSAFLAFISILFYPFFIFYQTLLLSETIFNTLLILSFFYIYKWYERGFKIDKYFLLANLFLVFSIYSKATLSILPPFLLFGFYFINTFNIKNSLKIFIYSILLYCIFLSPWWIRNYNIFNTFIPFTTSGGINLYLGNNINNKFGGCDWGSDVEKEKVRKINLILDEVLRDKAFKREALNFIEKNPKEFFKLMWFKFKRFWNITPNADGFNQGVYKWISIFSYGLILFLAIISIFIHIKKFKELAPIYILMLYFILIHIIIIASIRYRLPLEPFLIVLATHVIGRIVNKYVEII